MSNTTDNQPGEALGAQIMEEVRRYNDGNGCTRRQLVDNILIAISQYESRAPLAAVAGDGVKITFGPNTTDAATGGSCSRCGGSIPTGCRCPAVCDRCGHTGMVVKGLCRAVIGEFGPQSERRVCECACYTTAAASSLPAATPPPTPSDAAMRAAEEPAAWESEQERLASCPFCYSRKVENWASRPPNKDKDVWCVFCHDCSCEGPEALTEKEAARLWNTRRGGE